MWIQHLEHSLSGFTPGLVCVRGLNIVGKGGNYWFFQTMARNWYHHWHLQLIYCEYMLVLLIFFFLVRIPCRLTQTIPLHLWRIEKTESSCTEFTPRKRGLTALSVSAISVGNSTLILLTGMVSLHSLEESVHPPFCPSLHCINSMRILINQFSYSCS